MFFSINASELVFGCATFDEIGFVRMREGGRDEGWKLLRMSIDGCGR